MANTLKLMVFFLMIMACFGRKHKIDVNQDDRKYISLSTFDFFKGGVLEVRLINFAAETMQKTDVFGFSLYCTENDIIDPYLSAYHDTCFLEENLSDEYYVAAMYFVFNFYNNVITINCSPRWKQPVHIYNGTDKVPSVLPQPNIFDDSSDKEIDDSTPLVCASPLLLTSEIVNNITYYNASFVLHVDDDSEEGLYNLYFHSCPNYVPDNKLFYNFTMEIVEKNARSYLSGDEMPFPIIYSTMVVIFFITGCFWVFLLRQSKHPTFKIHYLMAVLILIKTILLVFQAICYHYIEVIGVDLPIWRIFFYIAHLLKDVLLVATISLISMGWTFIKHSLLPKEKIIIIVIIFLQILSDITAIKLDEIEIGDRQYKKWRTVYVLVDLICCGFFLIPIVWSIRQLKCAPATLTNIRKVKLFRYFFIMLVFYIYLSRIAVYLLHLTVPFKYSWLQIVFQEVSVYIFFVLTGYKFRPEILSDSGTMDRFTSDSPVIGSKHGAFIAEITDEEKDALLLENEYENN